MAAYHAALEARSKEIAESRTEPGTVNAAVVLLYKSLKFTGNKPITQLSDRRILEGFRGRFGKLRIDARDLNRNIIERILAEKAGKPARQRHLLRLIRQLLDVAVEQGWRTDNPAIGIKLKRGKTQGYHSWTEDELQQYEQHHAVGTKPRLAFALLFYTAVRIADVVKFGPANIRNGWLYFTYSKNGAEMKIQVAPQLSEAIAETKTIGVTTYLVTDQGKPYTAHSFGNRFKEWCVEAGLPHCSAHGLRKGWLRRMAESDCTEDQIAAMSGHTNMDEIRTYVRAANKAKMAAEGQRKTLARFGTKED
jgi:integrase